jgi:hypothetical protein
MGLMLLSTTAAVAQNSEFNPAQPPTALLAGLGMFVLVFGLIVYVYMSLALQTVAKKTNTENAWLAWIPIANIVLLLAIAQKPIWWIILFFIPIVSIIMAVIVTMAVAEARGKPNWWGILMIVPVVNLIVPGYLAWSD